MKNIILVLILSISFTILKAQGKLDYGVSIIYNISSQTNFNPQIPDDGTFQWNSLKTQGVGLIIGKAIGTKFYLTNRFLFQQKGYTEEAQSAYIGINFHSPLIHHTLQNKFNYITLESSLGYNLFKLKALKITPHLGLNSNLLLYQMIESERLDLVNPSYPTSEYSGNWKRISVGYNAGVSFSFHEKINLGFEFQRSISPLLKTDILLVKDWTWAVKMDLLLSEIF